VADRLYELKEGLRVHLVLSGEKKLGEDVIVTFAKFVIEHDSTPRKCQLETGRVYPPSPDDSDYCPDVVVVGAASRDLAAGDQRGWRLGGAATYCSLAAARLGLRVGCLLGVDGEAADADELGLLRAAGVELRLVRLDHGPVFENLDTEGHRSQRWLSKSDEVPARALPKAWLGSHGWLLVPVAGEVGEQWAGIAASGGRVALGPQGMLREFVDDGSIRRVDLWPSALLRTAGLVCVSLDDLTVGAELGYLRALAPEAAIVLTAGDGGGVALRVGGLFRYRSVAANHVVDPTGAGDVFLAALMAAWLATGEPVTSRALRFAAAAGSCAVEGVGLAAVPTRLQVAQRLRSSVPSV
jgi:sugar/nucleoside kinase (ribokinase family)